MSRTLMGEEQNAAIALRLRQGDRSAWEEMYDFYSRDMWRYVSRLMGEDKESVAEVIQEVFLAAAKNAYRYNEKHGSLWAWLTGIAHRQTASWYRSQNRSKQILNKSVQNHLRQNHHKSSMIESPFNLLEKTELRETVRSALAELTAEYAMLLTAKYMDHLSVEDIQIQFGGTSDSVRSKLKRARAEFRQLFERMNSGGLG